MRVPQKQRVTRDFPKFFKHLKGLGFDPSVCIDVGAAAGTPPIYEAFPEATHFAFEPLEDFQDALAKCLAPYQHEIRKCALLEEAGDRPILRHSDLFGSSLMHRRDAESENVETVSVSTLDDEMRGVDLSGEVLLKTDCQGADLLVLKGGEETLASVDVAIVEISFFPFWGPHQPVFYDLLVFMKERGFVVYDFLDGLFRPSDGALGQIDAVFVPENGALRKETHW